MADKRAWWTLSITNEATLSDVDRAHIAKTILSGYTSGEVVQDDPVTSEDASTGVGVSAYLKGSDDLISL